MSCSMWQASLPGGMSKTKGRSLYRHVEREHLVEETRLRQGADVLRLTELRNYSSVPCLSDGEATSISAPGSGTRLLTEVPGLSCGPVR